MANVYSTLRAVSSRQDVTELVHRARPLQESLSHWLETLPPQLRLGQDASVDDGGDGTPRSTASLHIAYFTAHLLIFRAILRPLVRQKCADDDAAIANEALTSCRDFMKMLIAVVRNLNLEYVSAFWPGFSRHCLCYPGLFCYMLCFQKLSPHHLHQDRELLMTWRNVLRARVGSWPLLRFAVVKVDAMFWKRLSHTREEKV